MSYDDFTAKLVTENFALKKQLDTAVEALDYITDAQFVWLNDDIVDEESLRPLREIAKAALAAIKE